MNSLSPVRKRHRKICFAGPWVGEFGWELCCWQGWLRRRAHLGDRIIACSRPGHEALYEDFAIDFVPFAPPPGEPNCYWLEGVSADSFRHLVPKGTTWLNPSEGIGFLVKDGCPYVPNQAYIQFGQQPAALEFDVVIHARDRRGPLKSRRNWPSQDWRELIQSFPSAWRVASIGSRVEANVFKGVDLRGMPLRGLMNRLRASRLVVGPSSGPIHLAALCGVPHVVWSGNIRDRIRYRELWNPLQVKHKLLKGWQPEPRDVFRAVAAMLRSRMTPKVDLVSSGDEVELVDARCPATSRGC
jgi:hypothetical protein